MQNTKIEFAFYTKIISIIFFLLFISNLSHIVPT